MHTSALLLRRQLIHYWGLKYLFTESERTHESLCSVSCPPPQIPFSGFGLFARIVLTVCFSRVIRVGAFMCTILPSPKPGCYMRRFPRLPSTLWEIVKVGYTEMRCV
jgi:hypothetical protein